MSNKRKQLSPIIIFLIILIGLSSTISVGYAKSSSELLLQDTPTPTPIPDVSTYTNAATFTFEDIGQDNITLYYPDSTAFDVSLPDYWKLSDQSSEIVFHYDLELTVGDRPDLSKAAETAINSGTLTVPVEVLMNNLVVGSFFPVVGKDQQLSFTIPANAFETLADPITNPANTYNIVLRFYLNTDIYCGLGANLTIYNDSRFNLNFSLEPPTRDLSYLPRMLVQGSFIPETLAIVIPDNYSDSDLTAAVNMATFVGSSLLGGVNYKVVTASEASNSALQPYSAILIGQPANNSLISDLYKGKTLPTTLEANGTIKKGNVSVAKEDGVVQIIPSPYNELNTFLIVTGNTDESVLFATQELKRTTEGLSSDVYIFHPYTETAASDTGEATNMYKVQFNDLVFSTIVFTGPGTTNVSLSFYVPRDWDIQNGAKIALNYNFSSRLGISSSALSVNLNGYPLGSAPFDTTIQGDRTEEILINPEMLIRGTVNTLIFSATRTPEYECIIIDPDILWITLRDNSVLEIPYKTIENAYRVAPFTHPFYYLANEGNLLVSIPQDPTAEDLNNIMMMMTTLGGAISTTTPLNITLTRSSSLDENMMKGTNLLVYGRPTQNAVVSKLNDDGVLIQPFVTDADVLKQQKANVEIHTPQDMNVGLIQVFPSEFDRFKGITVVTGTSPEGMTYVLDDTRELYEYDGADLFYMLANNNFFTYLSSVNVADIADLVESDTTQDEGVETVQMYTPVPETVPADQNNKGVIGPVLLIGLIGIGVIIIIIGLYQLLRNRVTKTK